MWVIIKRHQNEIKKPETCDSGFRCGERGICLVQKLSIKPTLRKAYYLSDTSTDTSFIRLLLF